MPNVNIPGKGIVQFPDSMTPADIEQAIASMDSGAPAASVPTTAPMESSKSEHSMGMVGAFKEGLGESVPGMMMSQKAPDFQPANIKESVAHMAGTVAGDWPLYVGGFLLGGGAALPTTAGVAAPVMATAGSMALPMGVRKVLIDKYTKGEITSPKEFLSRVVGTVLETAKGEAIGAAGNLAGKPFQASKYWSVQKLKTPAEIAAFTTMASGLEGKLPTPEDFAINAVAVGGIYGAGRVTKALKKVYVQTGKTPKEVAADIERKKAADNSEVVLTDVDLNSIDKAVKGKADFVTDSQMSPSVIDLPGNMVTVKGEPEMIKRFDRTKYNELVAQGIDKKQARKQSFTKVPKVPEELKPDVVDRRAEVQANLEANKAKLDEVLNRGIVTQAQVEELIAQQNMKALGLEERPAEDPYRAQVTEALLSWVRERDKGEQAPVSKRQEIVDRRKEVASKLATQDEPVAPLPDKSKGTILAEMDEPGINKPIESGIKEPEVKGGEFFYQTGTKRGELTPEALKAEQDHVNQVFPELSIRFDAKGELPPDAQAQILGKVITLSQTKADVTSIPHEVVHHAIRLMPDNPLVVKGMKMFGDLEQLTQRVADFYADKIVDRRLRARVATWLKEYWSSLKNTVGKANQDDIARLMSRGIYKGEFSAKVKAETLTPLELTTVRNNLLYQGGNPDRINTKLKVFDNLAGMKQNVNLDQIPFKNISKEEQAFVGHVVGELKAQGKKVVTPQELQDALTERLIPIEINREMSMPTIEQHNRAYISEIAQRMLNGEKVTTNSGDVYYIRKNQDGSISFNTKQYGEDSNVVNWSKASPEQQVRRLTDSILEDTPNLSQFLTSLSGRPKPTKSPTIISTVGNQGNPKDFGVDTAHRYMFETPIDFGEEAHGNIPSTTAAGWFEAGPLSKDPGTLVVFEIQPSDAVKGLQGEAGTELVNSDNFNTAYSKDYVNDITKVSSFATGINRYFYRSIIQWAAKNGYNKVRFPTGKSVEEIEGVEADLLYSDLYKDGHLVTEMPTAIIRLWKSALGSETDPIAIAARDALAKQGYTFVARPHGTVQLADNLAARMEKEYKGRTKRVDGNEEPKEIRIGNEAVLLTDGREIAQSGGGLVVRTYDIAKGTVEEIPISGAKSYELMDKVGIKQKEKPFLEVSLTPDDAGRSVPLFQATKMPTSLTGYLGNKKAMIQAGAFKALQNVADTYDRIVEPFGGSGLFGNYVGGKNKSKVLNDLNPDVINFHQQTQTPKLAKQVQAIASNFLSKIDAIKEKYPDGGQEAYAEVRHVWKEFVVTGKKGTPAEQAAVYWMQHNSTYTSQSKSPLFIGVKPNEKRQGHSRPFYWRYVPEEKASHLNKILENVDHLSKTNIISKDARQVLVDAKPGELVLLDPPYIPSSESGAKVENVVQYKKGSDLQKMPGAISFIKDDMSQAVQEGKSLVYTNYAHPIIIQALQDIGMHVEIVTRKGASQSTLKEVREVVAYTPDVWSRIQNMQPVMERPLFQRVPKDNTANDILDEVSGTNLQIEDATGVRDLPTIIKSLHFAEHVLRNFPAAQADAGKIIEAGMLLNDRVGRSKEYLNIVKGDLSKEEQAKVRPAMEKMYAGEATGAGDRIDRAARMMISYFDDVRNRFKESRREIFKQNLPDNVYQAFDQIIHGKDIRTAVQGMSEQDVANLRKTVGEYNAINQWGMDDFITHIELGAWKIMKPDGEVVGVAETRREAYVKAKELAKTDGYTKLEVKANAKMPSPVKATKNILKGTANIFDVMDAYSYSVEKRINLDPALSGVKRAMEQGDIEQYPDGVRKYLDKMMADAQGTYSIFEKAVDGIFLKMGMASGKYNKVMHGIMQGEAAMKLGYRAAAGFINGVVGFAHTYVKTGAFLMNEADKFNATAEGKAFLTRNEPYLGLGYIMETGGKMRIKSPFYHPLKMFTFAEPAIRKNNLTANYLQFIQDGMSPEAAEVAARRALRFQQNLFSIAGMPEILRSKEMRVVGMFKSFLIREMEFISSLRGDEAMRYLGMFVTLGGPKAAIATLLSMPLIGGLLHLDDLDNKLNEEYPGWYRGLPGLIGADLSMSTALQLPQKATDWAGPFVADIIKLGQELGPIFGGKKYAMDTFNTREGIEGVLGQMFTQSRYITKLIEGMIDKEGWVRNNKGQKLYRINNNFERSLLILGANPTHISQEQQVMRRLDEEAKAKADNVGRVLTHATRELRRTKRLSQDTVNNMILLGITPEAFEERVKGTELEPFVRYLMKTPDQGKPGVIDAWPSTGQ